MPAPFTGKIAVDICDSEPGRAAYLAPKAPDDAPNVLMLTLDDHPPLSGWGHFEHDEWELFNLETDRSQATNLAADEPERLEKLKGLWFHCAGRDNGLPVDDRSAIEQVLAERPHAAPPREHYTFYPDDVDVSGERYLDHQAQVHAWFAID